LGNALTYVLISSVVLGVLAIAFMNPLLIAFGADEQTLPHAYTYTAIKALGVPFMFIFFAMNHPIRAVGNAKRFAAAQIMGALLNIVLNPLFIFTFGMGIAGAAWSTVLVWALGGAWVMRYYFKGSPAIAIRLKYLKPSLKVLGVIASIGMAPFFMQILGSAITIVANRSLRDLGGSTAIAAFTAINGVIALFTMPVFGITQGSQPIIGFNYGMGDMQRVRTAYFSAMIYSVVICAVGSVLLLAIPGPVMGLFNNEPEALAIGTTAMRIMVWSLTIAGFQMNAGTFFMSIGRAKISVFLSVLRLGIIIIPMFFILPQVFGFFGIERLLGVWWAFPVSDVLAFTISLIMILRELRIIKSKEKVLT
jgi:putative MATE family efflux protein